MKDKISVVLPCHNEEKNIAVLIPEIIKNIPKKYSYEIILVDDGSTDKTSEAIQKLASKNKNIKGIIFHRNFGHQEALRSGISSSNGIAVITMDSDFQHPPFIIPKLIETWEKGHDLVQAKKKEDKTASFSRKIQRKIGYFIWSKISDGILIPGISDFRLMDRQISDYINSSNEKVIFLRGLVMLAAKTPTTIDYKVGTRKFGQSSYTTRKFINMFINGFLSFSTKPMRLTTLFGLVILLSSFVFLLIDFARTLIFHISIIQGWLTIVFLLLMLDGFIIFFLGVIGEYIGILFQEIKKRPRSVISKTINIKS